MSVECDSPIMRKESIDELLREKTKADTLVSQISSLKDMKIELELNEKVLESNHERKKGEWVVAV